MSQGVYKFTPSVAGNNKYFTLGSFLPTWAKLYVSDDTSGSDSAAHVCAGETDGTTQSYDASFKQGANEQYDNNGTANRIIKHIAHNGTNFTTPVELEFLTFTTLGGNNTIKMNVHAASSNYKVTIVCGN
jgi:hypothetical protein